MVSSEQGAIKVRCICGKEQEVTNRHPLKVGYSCGCVKPPPDAAGPRRARIEQRIRRTDTSLYLLDIVRKRKAVREGRLECSLTPEDLQVPSVCPERGVPLRPGRGGQKTADSPTVVRLDLSLGYLPDNIRIISWAAAQELNRQRLAEKRAAALAAAEKAEAQAEQEAEAARKAEQEALNAKRRKRWITELERWITELERWITELERPIYNKEVSTLPCSVRLDRALQRLGVKTVMDLLVLEPRHFHEQRNVGRTSVKELKSHMKGLCVMWPNPVAVWLLQDGPVGRADD